MLRKILKIVTIVGVITFGAIQFVRPDFSNPPVIEAETIWTDPDLPPDVRAVLVRSCADCHSNETTYPWYSKITPFNWFLAGHIEEGRHELNLSIWNAYTNDKKRHKLEEVCEQVEQGLMPLPSYTWIHWDAVLTDSERTVLCRWSKAGSDQIIP